MADNDLDDETGQETGAEFRKKYEKLLKDNAETKAELAKANRRAAFLEAGVDMSNPLSKYFVNGYDGDVEAEAIKKAATEAGLIAKVEATPPEPPKPPVTEEAAAFAVINAAAGAGNTQLSAPDLLAGMQKALEDSGGDTEAMANYMRSHGLPVAEQY